jgi:hypothetical protein
MNYPSLDFGRWQRIATVLISDITHCRDELARIAQQEKRIDQFWARGLIRSFLAYIESSVYEMRLVVRDADDARRIKLSAAERSLINEETYELTESGKPQIRTRYLKIERNFRFTTELFAQVFEVTSDIDYSGSGWSAFLDAIKIRNRITHPRDPESINLSLEEVETIVNAFRWYLDSTDSLLNRSNAKLQSQNTEMQAALAALRSVSTPPLPPRP